MRLKPLKFVILATVSTAAVYLLLTPFLFPRSIEAITNAPVAVVRASIDGRFGRTPIVAGEMIHQGSMVGSIANGRANGTFLLELHNDRALLAATVNALDQQLKLLSDRRSDLESLIARSRENLLERLRSQLREQQIRVKGLAVDHVLLVGEAARQGQLLARNVSTGVRVETAQQTAEIARLKAEAERERAVHMAWQVEAVSKSLIFDLDGSITSARIRMDEIDEKLLLLRSERLSKSEKLAEVEGSIRREQQRIELLGKADLVAPITGKVWQVPVADDEFVKEGEPLLEIVNCAAQVVTATVSERTFNRLEIGQPVEFLSEGDGRRQRGTIIQAHGPASRVNATRFAIRPAATESKEFRIVAQLAGEPPAAAMQSAGTHAGDRCSIGRTGKMFFEPRFPMVLDQIVTTGRGWWDTTMQVVMTELRKSERNQDASRRISRSVHSAPQAARDAI
jgi:multidrug resistance efflux pump